MATNPNSDRQPSPRSSTSSQSPITCSPLRQSSMPHTSPLRRSPRKSTPCRKRSFPLCDANKEEPSEAKRQRLNKEINEDNAAPGAKPCKQNEEDENESWAEVRSNLVEFCLAYGSTLSKEALKSAVRSMKNDELEILGHGYLQLCTDGEAESVKLEKQLSKDREELQESEEQLHEKMKAMEKLRHEIYSNRIKLNEKKEHFRKKIVDFVSDIHCRRDTTKPT